MKPEIQLKAREAMAWLRKMKSEWDRLTPDQRTSRMKLHDRQMAELDAAYLAETGVDLRLARRAAHIRRDKLPHADGAEAQRLEDELGEIQVQVEVDKLLHVLNKRPPADMGTATVSGSI